MSLNDHSWADMYWSPLPFDSPKLTGAVAAESLEGTIFATCHACAHVMKYGSSKNKSNAWRHTISKHWDLNPAAILNAANKAPPISKEALWKMLTLCFTEARVPLDNLQNRNWQLLLTAVIGRPPAINELHNLGHQIELEYFQRFCSLQGDSPLRLMLGTWTEPHSATSYIGIIASVFVPSIGRMQNWALACRPHLGRTTAHELADFVREHLVRLNLPQSIESFTADNASNVVAISSLLGARSVGCYAHLVNLCANFAFRNVIAIWKRLIRDPVTSLNQSTAHAQWKRHAELHNSSPLEFILWNDTRWLGKFLSLRRFADLTPQPCCRAFLEPSCSSEDFKALCWTVSILQPIAQLTVDITQEQNEGLPVLFPCHFGTVYRSIFFALWHLCEVVSLLEIDDLSPDHAQPLANLVVDLLSALENRFFLSVSSDIKLGFALTMGSLQIVGMRMASAAEIDEFNLRTPNDELDTAIPHTDLSEQISQFDALDTDENGNRTLLEEEGELVDSPADDDICDDTSIEDMDVDINEDGMDPLTLEEAINAEDDEMAATAAPIPSTPREDTCSPDLNTHYKVPPKRSSQALLQNPTLLPSPPTPPLHSSPYNTPVDQKAATNNGPRRSTRGKKPAASQLPLSPAQPGPNTLESEPTLSSDVLKEALPQKNAPTASETEKEKKSAFSPNTQLYWTTYSLRAWVGSFARRFLQTWDDWTDEESQNALILEQMKKGSITSPPLPKVTSRLRSPSNPLYTPVADLIGRLNELDAANQTSSLEAELRLFRFHQFESRTSNKFTSALEWCGSPSSQSTPRIRQIILSTHTIPVSSVAAEALFSSAKVNSDPLISNLSAEDFETDVLVRFNGRNFSGDDHLALLGLSSFNWCQIHVDRYLEQKEAETNKKLTKSSRSNTGPAVLKRKENAAQRRLDVRNASDLSQKPPTHQEPPKKKIVPLPAPG